MVKLVERTFFRPTEVRLNESVDQNGSLKNGNTSPRVQVLRVGKFNHPKYGEFEITTKTLQEMKSNFEKKIRGVDIAFDYFHKSDEEASGWPKELTLNEDQTELWAEVEWTPAASKKLAEREIRYFSPDFAFEWQDPESGAVFKNVLFGGGLTNRPFVKDMAAIVAAEKSMEMEKKDIEALIDAKVIKLSEDNEKKMSAMMAENAELKKKLAEMAEKPKPAPQGDAAGPDGDEDAEDNDPESLKAKLAESKKKLAEYAEKDKKSQAAAQLAEKEKDFTVMLSEGKACAAQKDAYIKGDMKAFAKLAQPVNLSENGSNANRNNSGGTDGDRADQVMTLAEAKMKADPKLSKIDAISLANKEVK